jgi:hypothetical protein
MSDATNKPGPNLSAAERSKKLTITRVVGKLAPMQDGAEKEWLADFYCYVTGNKQEESAFGEYSRWMGEFRSVNCTTGEVLISANAIFPSIASDLIAAAYAGGKEQANVMLAFRLGREPDWKDDNGVRMPGNKTGYKYCIRDIVAPSNRSPLDLLYAEVHAPLIEAPEPLKAIENAGQTAEMQAAAVKETPRQNKKAA